LKKYSYALFLILLLLVFSGFAFSNAESKYFIKTYDFMDLTFHRAFEGNSSYQPPENLGIGLEISPEEYFNISKLDGRLAMYEYPPVYEGTSDYHRFKFKIDVLNINKIVITHFGLGNSAGEPEINPGLKLYIWNGDKWEEWDEHDEGMGDVNGIAVAELTGDLSKYIDQDGYIHVLVQAKENGGSCPFLYTYNGEEYVFVADLYSWGTLGVPFYNPIPGDHLKIDGGNLGEIDGLIKMQLVQEYDEISYLDSLYLKTVDHSPEVNVFPSILIPETGKLLTVKKELISPVRAVDENGKDITPYILEKDGVFTHGKQYKLDLIDLELGDLSDADQIKLVFNTYTNWDNDEVLGAGPKPYERFVQVKNEGGEWTTVIDTNELFSPHALPRTYVLNLTDKFLTDDYSVRIGYYFDVRFDYIGVDTSKQKELVTTMVATSYADLHFRGYSNLEGAPISPDYHDYTLDPPKHYSQPSGNFTRYGDVLDLISEIDDEFVVMHHGDEITLHFNSPHINGTMERDFILYCNGYYKGDDFPTGDTVEPLPFHQMSSYPYSENEEYPFEEHIDYLTEYNTRMYNGVTMDEDDHNTIYTDYVKVEVFHGVAVGGELLSANTLGLLAVFLIIITIMLTGTLSLFKTKKHQFTRS
jgi:hypothetical protein